MTKDAPLRETEAPTQTTILVADDTRANLRLLVDVLSKAGYRVLPVLNGTSALAAARSEHPDLILLDIMMPDISGFEVCQQLKADERTRAIPVIFISALNEVLDKVRAFDVGGVDYLSKPIEPKEVLARIRTHLALRAAQHQLQTQNVELQRAKDAADAANRAKSAFLASMSHELRTPLNGVLGFAQVLRNDPQLSKPQQERVTMIEQSGTHLLALINDVLDLAKVESGKFDLAPTNFHLPSFLQHVADMIRIRTAEKALIFHIEHSDRLPASLHGDEQRLRQILLNLLGNAVKFTECGEISLRVFPVPPPPHSSTPAIRFEIQDTGIGIAADHLQTIFEPFQQAGSLRYRAQGTGLGLAISRKLIQLMGGELHVESAPGQGSTFWFEIALPEADVEESDMNTENRPIVGVNGELPRLLVVDDDWGSRKVILDLLAPLGFEILEASNGQEALNTAQAYHPDGIIADIMMPEMDGLELIRRIRQFPEFHAMVVIATSASVYEEDRQRCLAAGSDAFFPKPIHAAHLFDLLQLHFNLTWMYAQQDTPPAQHFSPTALPPILPPVEVLTTLLDSLDVGDIVTIRSHLDDLERANPRLVPFTTTLRRLAGGFRILEMREFLDACQHEQKIN